MMRIQRNQILSHMCEINKIRFLFLAHSLHSPVEAGTAIRAAPVDLWRKISWGKYSLPPRSPYICFFFVIHSLKLRGDVDIRRAAATSTARAATKTTGARRSWISALFDLLGSWLLHAIFCDDIFCAPNNQADLQKRNQCMKRRQVLV